MRLKMDVNGMLKVKKLYFYLILSTRGVCEMQGVKFTLMKKNYIF